MKLKAFKNLAIIKILLFTVLTIFGQQRPSILVGPNVMVTSEYPKDGSSYELHAAADPTNASNILCNSRLNILQPLHGQVHHDARGYYSCDGGNSWKTIKYSEVMSRGGGDPQVGYGRTGTGYFVTISKDEILFYRSEDGGITWGKPVHVPYMDHELIAVDHSAGRFAGNIYLSGLITESEFVGTYPHKIAIYRSTDDGKTWIGPVVVANYLDIPGVQGLNTSIASPLFTDGELFVPFHDFVELGTRKNTDAYHYWFVTSKDGGVTFSAPQKLRLKDGGEITGGGTQPIYAADRSEGAFKNRIYVAWANQEYSYDWTNENKPDSKNMRILISYSSDRGKTWSTPKMITTAAPDNSYQFMPTLAVNNEGTVAVAWYDARMPTDGNGQMMIHQYISASVDGGESFLPAVQVTSIATIPQEVKKLTAVDAGDSVIRLFDSGVMGYGDYFAMVASNDGTFHPFWVDGRTGSSQIWTAGVRVERPDKVNIKRAKPVLVEADVSKEVGVIAESFTQFPPSGTIELPIRIKNKSDKPIYGPLMVEVTLAIPGGIAPILNADNGKGGVGATFDYTRSLGSLGVLQPGAISEEIIWRFKTPFKAEDFPGLNLKIKARVEQKKD